MSENESSLQQDNSGKVSEKSDDDDNSAKTSTERTPRQKRRDRKKQRKKQAKAATSKPSFKGATPDIQDNVFVLDPKHRGKLWMKSREAFIDYAGSKFGADVKLSLTSGQISVDSVTTPKVYTTDEFKELQKDHPYEFELWKVDVKEYREAKRKLKHHLGQLYSKLWGQCDIAMRNKIKTNPSYEDAYNKNDVISLLSIIDEICGTEDQSSYPPLQKYITNKRLHDFKQTEEMTLAEYYQEFTLLANIAAKSGNEYGSPALMKYVQTNHEEYSSIADIDPDLVSPDDRESLRKEANETYLAVVMTMNASDRYAAYKQQCHNNYVQGKNDWPISIVDAYTSLDQFRFDPSIYQKKTAESTQTAAYSFLNEGNQRTQVSCYNCDRVGHYSRDCTYITKENGKPTRKALQECAEREDKETPVTQGNNLLTHDGTPDYNDELTDDDYSIQIVNGHTLLNNAEGRTIIADLRGNDKCVFNQSENHINQKWILLDNCSTVNVFSNPSFLTNIRKVEEELHLFTNAGEAIINHKGTLRGFGDVWYHAKGIANILGYNSVANMKDVHIQYNNATGRDVFEVHGPNGRVLEFKPSTKGLYHWEPQECGEDMFPHLRQETGMTLVETIAENKKKFTESDVKRAEAARAFQAKAGQLSYNQLLRIVRKGQLLNCPVTPRDVKIMQAIFGPSIPGLKGKTVRRGKPAVTPELIPLPRSIKEHYRKIILGIDVMYINRIPFLTTISRGLHYGTCTPLKTTKGQVILEVIKQLSNYYSQRNFKIRIILADGQFKCLTNDLAGLGIHLNCVSAEEHVPEIERYHRTIKERCRSMYHATPFTRMPKRLLVELARTSVYYLNAFPWKGGATETMAPVTILTGMAPDYRLHFQAQFGTYAQIRQTTSNTMKARTSGAIATGPSTNIQGGLRFFSLKTGQLQDRTKNDYQLLPMPTEVIQRVHQMAKNSPPGLAFENRHQEPEVDITDDESEATHDDDSSTSTTSSSSSEASDSSSENGQTTQNMTTEPTGVEADDNVTEAADDDNVEEDSDTTADGEDGEHTSTNDTNSDSDEDNDNEPRSSYGRRLNTGQNSRPMDDQYEYQYLQVENASPPIEVIDTENERSNLSNSHALWNKVTIDPINEFILTQYSLRSGLKKFGKLGQEATMKELRQMLRRNVFVEIDYHTLTTEDKERALPILLFLTMKRDGTIKGRACADGRKQRIWMQKEDSSSPTIAPEALFYTLVIDALEGRDVATCDLPGHFLQTDMDERLILRIDGDLAKLLVEVDPSKWRKHLRKERGRPVIYVRCNKAIYGTLNAALLSYKKLIGHLTEWGFEMNPYDPCCWNKQVDGKQMTTVFHVDDLKLSHVNPDRVTETIELLESVYAKLDPMTKTRGKVHQYLGMTIDFRTKGEVRISMFDYVKKMIDILPQDMIGEKPTAAPDHLFKTDDVNATPLDKERSELFHSLTAMSLYLGKRARPDLQTPTAFLCTRVKNPDEHDWKKLTHQMKYLQATRHLPLILRSNGRGTAIYIDGAHAVHSDMKGHAGAMTTEGVGSVFASSTKTKLNTLSSTETEVVATGEKLPKFVWYRLFRLSQGQSSREDILYQDNMSAMLLNKNGRFSCGKGSKHIAIRFFFITDQIKKGNIRVEYCPTEEMIADYFTKPLQGSLFRKFRDMILGIREEDYEEYQRLYNETIKEFGLDDQ